MDLEPLLLFEGRPHLLELLLHYEPLKLAVVFQSLNFLPRIVFNLEKTVTPLDVGSFLHQELQLLVILVRSIVTIPLLDHDRSQVKSFGPPIHVFRIFNNVEHLFFVGDDEHEVVKFKIV